MTEDHKKEMDQLMSHVAKQSSAIVELKVCSGMVWVVIWGRVVCIVMWGRVVWGRGVC